MTEKTGIFYGVGVGPGDPELMTMKAVRVLEACDVIAVPKSSGAAHDAQSHALGIASKGANLKSKKILELLLPMTKDAAQLEKARQSAAGLIAARLEKREDVAFITLGDPMLYSTFSYLVPFVKALVPSVIIKIVPGVTSFSAVAALTNLPLAEADEKVAIIPAAYDMEDLRERIISNDTVVLMKVNNVTDRLIGLLCSMGLEKNAVFVSSAGMPDERVVTDIRTLKGKKPGYFSTVIIKK